MTESIAFYCRAKPQGIDAFPIFKEANMVFIGYPVIPDGMYDPNNLQSCIVNPTCTDTQWRKALADAGITNRREFNKNRNFIKDVSVGSIVAVPRPTDGLVYLARVSGSFEIIDRPAWGQKYIEVRRRLYADSDDADHINQHTEDVAQGWPVDEYRPISLTTIPGWIRRSLYGQTTYGRLKSHPLTGKTAWSVLDSIIDGNIQLSRQWTLDHDAIKMRLVDDLNPSSFEHLVVSLLQLENPDEIWIHTGGPGDGGVDGVGSDSRGSVTGLVQCKMGEFSPPHASLSERPTHTMQLFAAALCDSPAEGLGDGVRTLDLDWIASRVARHWKYLPQARTMRIGYSD